MKNKKKILQKINNKINEINELNKISEDAIKPVELDQNSVGRVSRIDAIQQQQINQANKRNRDNQINRLNNAIMRLNNDQYGYCVECGEEISPKRLEIDPAAEKCIECAGGYRLHN